MIAAGLFTIAGMIAWQNTNGIASDTEGETGETGFFVYLTIMCWIIAGLCASGAITAN